MAHNNQISTVPGNLDFLEILDLSHNRMSNFSVARMKRLTQLIASHNMIENMPLGICNLPDLQVGSGSGASEWRFNYYDYDDDEFFL